MVGKASSPKGFASLANKNTVFLPLALWRYQDDYRLQADSSRQSQPKKKEEDDDDDDELRFHINNDGAQLTKATLKVHTKELSAQIWALRLGKGFLQDYLL